MNVPLSWDIADQVANCAMCVEQPNAFDVAVRNNWVVSEARAAPSSSCKAVMPVTKVRKLSAG